MFYLKAIEDNIDQSLHEYLGITPFPAKIWPDLVHFPMWWNLRYYM